MFNKQTLVFNPTKLSILFYGKYYEYQYLDKKSEFEKEQGLITATKSKETRSSGYTLYLIKLQLYDYVHGYGRSIGLLSQVYLLYMVERTQLYRHQLMTRHLIFNICLLSGSDLILIYLLTSFHKCIFMEKFFKLIYHQMSSLAALL